MTHPTLEDLQNEATWLERRALIPEPLHSTGFVTTEQSRQEFLEGARLLRLDQKRNFAGEVIGPTPIQLAIADVLASGHKLNAILEPRRTTKTTAIQAVLVGRCSLREDYLVGTTMATTGAKSGERFKQDIAAALERVYPDKRNRPFRISYAKGSEGLIWNGTGSYYSVYTPTGDSYRSNAFDVAWVDEAGEAELAMGEDLIAAIRPTLHTRANAQFIMSGTAGAFRSGQLLWDGLTDPTAAVLRHGVPDDIDPDELSSWEPEEDQETGEVGKGRVRELVELVHPGIGWTTPLSAIEEDWNTPAMRKKFPAEILSVFALEGSNTALISQPKWTGSAQTLAQAGTVAPKPFALAAFVDRDMLYASVAAAWNGKDGKIHVGLLHHQKGVAGFGQKLLALSRKHKRAITYDSWSNTTEVELKALRESRPAPTERPMTSKSVARAAVNLVNLINQDGIRHHDQVELNGAVEVAVKRAFSTGTGWAFGKPKGQDDVDITGLEAIAMAVYVLDQEKERRPLTEAMAFA